MLNKKIISKDAVISRINFWQALKNNQIPDKKDWNLNEWSDEDNGQCNDFEKPIESEELPVSVNFECEKDSNGNPSLFIPNLDSTHNTKGRAFNRIEYDQAASHLNHANEFGIQLPEDFDMSKYNALPTKFDKIQYAKQHVSPPFRGSGWSGGTGAPTSCTDPSSSFAAS